MKLITGMHRSATSLVSRLFFEAGADFGDPQTLYRGDQWNPDGYYEQPDFHKINMPLINGPWGKFAYFWLPSRQTIMRRSTSFAEDIRRMNAKYQGTFVKEARFSLTLPAWLEQGAAIDGVLVCLRDPYQVAKSLVIRNKTVIRHGLHLWYRHNSELLDSLGNIPTYYVSYGHLLASDTAIREVHGAFNFFGLNVPQEKVTDICNRVIDPSKNDCPKVKQHYPKHIQELWGELQERHSRQFDRSSN